MNQAQDQTRGIASTAVREGGHYVLNGLEDVVTSGIQADLVIVAVRTAASERRLSLVVVEAEMEAPACRKLEHHR